MKILVILLAFFCVSSCGVADSSKSSDGVKIQGTWAAQTESQNGNTKSVSYLYVFKDDKITFIDETGKEMKYLFRLDTTGHPKLIALRPEATPGDTTAVSVAYELKGDSLKIVVAPVGLRPTEISDKNDQELIICTRKGL